METLYLKYKGPGRKAYVPRIAGKRRPVYRTATEAQAHSLRVRERYYRLKAAELKLKLQAEKLEIVASKQGTATDDKP